MMSFNIHKVPVQLIGFLVLLISCNDNEREKETSIPAVTENTTQIKKSASTFQDTLLIDYPAAVFYHPDSVQLQLIRSKADSMAYDGAMHEFFYQMRNARIIIKNTWPSLSIVESKNNRYILFKKDSSSLIIDLDTKTDPYGLIVYNTKKDPIQVDMTNMETGISFYLK